MQSPLLHQMSSLRGSIAPEDHSNAMNYHDVTRADPGLRPRAAIPLSSLASSSSGGDLAATILDISANSSSHPPSSSFVPFSSQAQPQSKSEQDLANYLATSNPTSAVHNTSLKGEPTLLHTSLSGEWTTPGHSLGEIFDRHGAYHLPSWGDMHGRPSNPSQSAASSSSVSSPTEMTIRPYSPRGEYLPPILPPAPARRNSDSWSASGSSHSNSSSRRTSVSYLAPLIAHRASPSLPPVPLPHPASLLRVNVNTAPRIPINPDSPHFLPTALPPTSLGLYPAPYSLSRSHTTSPFSGELAYPGDPVAEAHHRFVSLSDLTAPPFPSVPVLEPAPDSRPSSSASQHDKRRRDERSASIGDESSAKRPCKRESDEEPLSAGVVSATGSANDSRSASENDTSLSSDEEEEDDYDDAEFVPGRAARKSGGGRTRRRVSVKHEVTEDVVPKPAPRKRRGTGKRHIGSAAEALRVISGLAAAAATGYKEASAAPQAPVKIESEGDSSTSGYAGAYKSMSVSASHAPALLPYQQHPYSTGLTQHYHHADPTFPLSTLSSLPSGPSVSAPQVPSVRSVSGSSTYGGVKANADGSDSTVNYDASRPLPRRNSTIPLPVPVPNLIKKSRGRRVPDAVATGGKQRTFVCSVEGCGKCFVRGEHLKRHVRSIHTYDKPYPCPFEGCGKSFSRRDNLAQHSRIHLDG